MKQIATAKNDLDISAEKTVLSFELPAGPDGYDLKGEVRAGDGTKDLASDGVYRVRAMLNGVVEVFRSDVVILAIARINTTNAQADWAIGDEVQNDNGDGDDWTGVIQGIISTSAFLVELKTGAYADIDTADGIENTTRTDTDTIVSKATQVARKAFDLEFSGLPSDVVTLHLQGLAADTDVDVEARLFTGVNMVEISEDEAAADALETALNDGVLDDILADTDALEGRLTSDRAARLDADVSSRAAASVCTEARLAELDAGGLPGHLDDVMDNTNDIIATTDLILADTNELQTDWHDGGRLDLILDALTAVFSGITSLADWLRGLFRKDAMDATALAEVNVDEGTYNEATDSQEAIGEMALAAAGTGTLFNKLGDSITVTTGNATGDLSDMEAPDDNYYEVTPVGNEIDFYVEFALGDKGLPSQVIWNGRLDKPSPSAETIDVYAYHWSESHWDKVGEILGIRSSDSDDDEALSFPLLTGYAEEGKVRVRFYKTGMNAADVFYIDQLYVSYGTLLAPQDIRDSMKLSPTGGSPEADSVDEHLDDIKAQTDLLPPDPASQSDVTTAESNIRGADSDDLKTLSDQLDGVCTLGAGAIEWEYLLTEPPEGSGPPIADADVWITTDEEGANVVATGRTDQYGKIKFMLDAGTVYVWRQKSGYDFVNPDTEEIS